jgi:hypothetical protein
LSVPEIVDRAIDLTVRYFAVAAICIWPAAILYDIAWEFGFEVHEAPAQLAAYTVLSALAFFFMQWGGAAAVTIFAAASRGERVGILAAYRRTRARLLALCLVGVPNVLLAIASEAVASSGTEVESTADALLRVFFLLSLVPVMIGTQLAFVSCVLEGVGPRRALINGFVRPLQWPLLRRTAYTALAVVLVCGVPGLASFLPALSVQALSHPPGDVVLSIIQDVTLAPFLNAFAVVYLLDFLKREEGTDLAEMLAGLPPRPNTLRAGISQQ